MTPSTDRLGSCFPTTSTTSVSTSNARSQGNAKLVIAESNASGMVFGNLLRKISEAAKYLVDRHAKIEATDIRAANKEQAEDATASKAAPEAP